MIRQRHQLVLQVDDLVKARAEHVLRSRLTALAWLHRLTLRLITQPSELQNQFAGKIAPSQRFLAASKPANAKVGKCDQ
jgi:hypothetical protein